MEAIRIISTGGVNLLTDSIPYRIYNDNKYSLLRLIVKLKYIFEDNCRLSDYEFEDVIEKNVSLIKVKSHNMYILKISLNSYVQWIESVEKLLKDKSIKKLNKLLKNK